MSEHTHRHNEHHNHSHQDSNTHTHGAVDPSIFTNKRGIWAIKRSFIILLVTAAFQAVVVVLSGSVGLLADTIHNFGDAATAIPLAIAFTLALRKPTKRYTYGYGRVEDFAGVIIVLIILTSAIVAGYESIDRFFHPGTITHLWVVAVASLTGFAGNEAAAVLRIKTGRQINSAALIADGYHARIDGITSLAVLIGVIGTWLGYPVADTIVGLIITVMILKIVWESGKTIFTRMLDGVEPEIINELIHAARHVKEVKEITEVRARWLGHMLHAELNITVSPQLSVEEGHKIAMDVQKEIHHHLNYLSNAVIHIDPSNASGEDHHFLAELHAPA